MSVEERFYESLLLAASDAAVWGAVVAQVVDSVDSAVRWLQGWPYEVLQTTDEHLWIEVTSLKRFPEYRGEWPVKTEI